MLFRSLAGGVAANSLLRMKCADLAKKNGFKLYIPDMPLCADNAAMIAARGYYKWIEGEIADLRLNAVATKDLCKESY